MSIHFTCFSLVCDYVIKICEFFLCKWITAYANNNIYCIMRCTLINVVLLHLNNAHVCCCLDCVIITTEWVESFPVDYLVMSRVRSLAGWQFFHLKILYIIIDLYTQTNKFDIFSQGE